MKEKHEDCVTYLEELKTDYDEYYKMFSEEFPFRKDLLQSKVFELFQPERLSEKTPVNNIIYRRSDSLNSMET